MVREQAEYDRLVGGITAATPRSEFTYSRSRNAQGNNREFLRTTVRSRVTEKPQSMPIPCKT